MRDFLLSLCDRLGVLVNLSKSSLHPTQTIDYLGMSLHSSPLRARVRPLVRVVDSRDLSIFDQSSRTSSDSVCHPRFSPSAPRTVCLAFHGQHLCSCLPPQTRGHQVSHTQFRGPDHPSSVRDQRCASAPPVCSREAQCPRGFPQPGFPSIGVRVDSARRCVKNSSTVGRPNIDFFATSMNHQLTSPQWWIPKHWPPTR